jgi:putative DNA primase/helicase
MNAAADSSSQGLSSGIELWEAGIQELVCIMPPDAVLSPGSTINPKARGKVPGRLNQQGQWAGSVGWQQHYPTSEEVRWWDHIGANVGVLAKHYPAFDIDIEDETLSDAIAGLVRARFGDKLMRRGRGEGPRQMLVFKASEPGAITKHRVEFSYEGREAQAVELLADGQQWVAGGTHPSGDAYETWFVRTDHKVHHLTVEEALDLFEEIVGLIEAMGGEIGERSSSTTRRENVSQELLKGDIDEVRELVESIPNDEVTMPHRDHWIRFGAALKGATQDEPEEGYALWCDFSARSWRAGDNTPEKVEEAWRGLKPPFGLGIEYLRRLAGVNTAQFVFDAIPRPDGVPPGSLGTEGGREAAGGVVGGEVQVYAFSDQRLARELLRQSDEFAHAAEVGWFVWDGVLWVPDHEDKRISTITQDYLWEKSREAYNDPALEVRRSEQLATRLASKAQVTAMLGIMEKRSAFDPQDFDSDPDILNTPAGIVDLPNGSVLPHDRSRRCSKVTAVAPERKRPERWEQFLEEATRGDRDLIRYLQTFMGYCITGHTKLHAILFITGPGGNGKSVFVETISHVLGDYAAVAPQGMFMQSKWDRHPADIASLMGARLVTSSETQAGGSWDEARVKAMTGGERMTARFMRQNFFTFTPRFKLVMTSNHEPAIQNLDQAWRRRMHVVPFEFLPPVPDPDLMEALRAEGPAILQWLIDGARRWYKEGVQKPKAVLEATEEYFETQNPVGRWLSECVEIDPEGFTASAHLLSSYEGWSVQNHEPFSGMTMTTLTNKILRELGGQVARGRSKDPKVRARGLNGIRLDKGSAAGIEQTIV